MEMELGDFLALGIMIGFMQTMLTLIGWVIYSEYQSKKREREAIERGYARRLYNEDSHGKFMWIEKEPQ